MRNLTKIIKNKAFLAFILSFILGSIIIIPYIMQGHGIYYLIADFNVQQIPFNEMINSSIKEGSIFWTWYNEIGSNFIGSFSFYNLFSPFNILGYLFPASWFPYLVGPIFILKYAVAGLTSFLFIKRYVKNKNYAVLASILYSFSGFQLTNILFYHFHDVVALFPLMLYALDKLVYEDKRFIFALIVSLMAFTNWFFFIGEVVFLIIYYLVKIITKSYEFKLRTFAIIIFESLIGVMLAGFVLVPTALFTYSNPRINGNWTFYTMIKFPISNYLELFRSILFPSQIMSFSSIIRDSNYSSTETYLPFIGIVLGISYFIKKPKKWDSILSLVLVIFMFIPILNSTFFAFTRTYYSRWFYIPILVFSLISARCLDEKIDIKIGIIINVVLVIIFSLGCLVYILIIKPEQFIYNKNYFIIMVIVCLLNLFILFIINLIKNSKLKHKLISIFIILFICFWGNYSTYNYKKIPDATYYSYKEYLHVGKYVSFHDVKRTNSSNLCPFNIGVLSKNSNLKSFNSNLNGSLFKFYNSIDQERGVSTVIELEDKKLNDFLSVEYVISCGEDLEKMGYTLYKDFNIYKIYYNKDYKKQGFTVNKYMNNNDFKKLKKQEKVNILNDTVILNEEQIEKYKNIIENNSSYELNNYKYVNNGLESKIISNSDTLAIYTIPYDKGWSAYINEKKVNIEEVDNGFMAIKINKGINNIRFKYYPPGLTFGIIISVSSLFIFLIYVILYMKGSRKNEK